MCKRKYNTILFNVSDILLFALNSKLEDLPFCYHWKERLMSVGEALKLGHHHTDCFPLM